jgi:hypothetical protein
VSSDLKTKVATEEPFRWLGLAVAAFFAVLLAALPSRGEVVDKVETPWFHHWTGTYTYSRAPRFFLIESVPHWVQLPFGDCAFYETFEVREVSREEYETTAIDEKGEGED